MLVTRLSICRLGLFECYVSLEAEHLSPSVRCARNKRQVSHSSTGSDIISLDAGLRMDGLHALDFLGRVN